MPSDEEEVEEQKWECFAAGRGCATSCPWGAVTLYLAWFPPGSRARAPRSHSFPSSETWVCRKEMKWWYIKHFLLFFSSEIWWVESPQQIQTSWLRGPSSFFYPYFLPLDIHCRAPVSCLRWVREHNGFRGARLAGAQKYPRVIPASCSKDPVGIICNPSQECSH